MKAGPAPPESNLVRSRGAGGGGGSLPPLNAVNSSTSHGSMQRGMISCRQGSGTLPANEASGFWLASQHLGDVGVHGAKALYGSRGPKSGARGVGGAGADFGATRGARDRRRGAGLGHYPDPATVTAASLGITVPEMDAVVQEDLALEDLSTWMDSYQSEVLSFSSSALNAELRYEEVLRSTASLGSPNAVRTRVVCQLLDAVVMRFGRFQRITKRLLHDVFASVFVDPDAPDAVPYFLRYARVQNQLNELRGKHDMLLSDLEGEEDRSSKRWAYINRTLKNMFNSQTVAAFRQWKLRVEDLIANRALIQRMIIKWRRQDIYRALYRWKENAAAAKQERSDAALEELRAVNEELSHRLEKTEGERDIANMEINHLNAELASARAQLEEARALNTEAAKNLANSQEECATYKAYKVVAEDYRQTLAGVASMKASAAKAEMEARKTPDAGPMHNEGEENLLAVEPFDKIMRWFNNHLVRLGKESLHNLSSDLSDGTQLAMLMHVGNPEEVPADKISALTDPAGRAKFAVDKAEEIFDFPAGCVEPEDIVNGVPATNLALVAWMMSYHHGMDRAPLPEKVLADCDAVIAAAAAAADRPIEEEVGPGGLPQPRSADLVQAINKADAAVRDLRAKRDDGEQKFNAYARDVMKFTLAFLIQASKGVKEPPGFKRLCQEAPLAAPLEGGEGEEAK